MLFDYGIKYLNDEDFAIWADGMSYNYIIRNDPEKAKILIHKLHETNNEHSFFECVRFAGMSGQIGILKMMLDDIKYREKHAYRCAFIEAKNNQNQDAIDFLLSIREEYGFSFVNE